MGKLLSTYDRLKLEIGEEMEGHNYQQRYSHGKHRKVQWTFYSEANSSETQPCYKKYQTQDT